MTDYSPFGDYLLLVPAESDAVSKGGIIIPEQSRRNMHEGTIIKLGPEAPSTLKEGMVIFFDQHSEYKIKDGEQLLYIVSAKNVLLCKPAKSPLPAGNDHFAPKEKPLIPLRKKPPLPSDAGRMF